MVYNLDWKAQTAKQTREKNLIRRYNLDWEGMLLILEEQEYKCPIMLTPLSEFDAHCDHSHKDGYVRGLLSSSANVGLGHLGDSVENLERAIVYLNKYKEWRDDVIS